jgi:hypothetical protein
VLRSIARQYDGSHKWGRLLVLGIVGLAGSIGLARSGLDSSPSPTAAFFGAAGMLLSLHLITVSVTGPVVAPCMDTDRILRDLDADQSLPESRA